LSPTLNQGPGITFQQKQKRLLSPNHLINFCHIQSWNQPVVIENKLDKFFLIQAVELCLIPHLINLCQQGLEGGKAVA